MKTKVQPGGWAWIGLVVYVVIADALLIWRKKSSMSKVFNAATVHPVRRWPVIVAWGILTIHLFEHFFPRWLTRIDPLAAIFERWPAKWYNKPDGD